jgi:hypothetical protein
MCMWVLATCHQDTHVAALFFSLGDMPCNSVQIQLNDNIAIKCTISKLFAASTAEADLGALFVNLKEARVICLILSELGHP